MKPMPKPFLVVRAHIDQAVLAEFQRWYRQEHLPHVLQIPGIVRAYRSHCRRPGINWTALYEFSDESVVQEALASQEAARARLDWQRWLPYVSELTVEVYTPASPLPIYHHWN